MYSSVQSWQMRRHEAREFGPFRLLSARRRHAWHGDEPIPRDSRASRSGIGCKRRQSSVGDSEGGDTERNFRKRQAQRSSLLFANNRESAEGALWIRFVKMLMSSRDVEPAPVRFEYWEGNAGFYRNRYGVTGGLRPPVRPLRPRARLDR